VPPAALGVPAAGTSAAAKPASRGPRESSGAPSCVFCIHANAPLVCQSWPPLRTGAYLLTLVPENAALVPECGALGAQPLAGPAGPRYYATSRRDETCAVVRFEWR